MRVDFYALLRPISGTSSITLDLPEGASLRQLIKVVLERYPAIHPHLVDASGELRDEVPIFINGRNPRLSPRGVDEPLTAGSVVSIFSPIASGKMNVEVLR